ncbi:sel1 repeat family protein [Shimia sp. R9_2]|uniref:tetratricopeptide repeat protein n=1 Tax=Shimia sp. R9_2 TaxID=2821112 RepID=UPI001ADAA58D|nr:tetratricopeptide repeat protein [Shimia sp. R9_2]MBO9398983.1 sel1 repeat family protein [Shimia sp. R9_2]
MNRILTVAALWLASAEVAAADCAEARSIWGDVKDSGSAQVFEEYLSVFGDCAIYSGLAREKLAALGNVQPSAPVSAPEHDPEPAVAENDEGQLTDWEVFEIENACMRAAIAPLHVEDYMGRAWDDIVTEEALAACAPVMDLDDPDPEAMAAYGRALMKAEDYKEAADVSLAAAMLGSGLGANNLGVLYEDGNGVPQDYGDALLYYTIAADYGSPFGHINVGDLYRDGKGVSVDAARAIDAYEAAADLEYGPAYERLGDLYRDGDIVPQSSSKAIYAYSSAHELGEYACGNEIAYIYETGQGDQPQNESEAFSWYLDVLLKGVTEEWATYRAGRMMLDGRGVEADEEKARNWFALGAHGGHAPSQRELGRLLHRWGEIDEAETWLRQAADQNDEDAQALLAIWF